MKKLLSTFLTLSCFVFILILPVFLWLHTSTMSHHDMSAGDCIEHCMSSEAQLHSPKIISLWNFAQVLGLKIFFSKIFELAIPLVLLYIALIYAPPNLRKSIKLLFTIYLSKKYYEKKLYFSYCSMSTLFDTWALNWSSYYYAYESSFWNDGSL